MSKLSAIVPVYKAEKSIRKCIDSIVNQSYNDWELILIDDGSPDNSGAICDEYAKIDKRIRVIHKVNEGVSIARNIGIENATGVYLTFIDSDDYLEGDSFSLVEDANSDLLVFESISYNSQNEIKKWYDINDDHISDNTTKIDFIKKYISLFVLDGPCAKFFRRDVLGNIRFPERQRLGEDNVFMLTFIKVCRTIDTITGCYYVIDDHYSNSNNKYLMSAKDASSYFANIMNAYDTLAVKVPSFEKRIYSILYNTIKSNESKMDWYSNICVINFIRRYPFYLFEMALRMIYGKLVCSIRSI